MTSQPSAELSSHETQKYTQTAILLHWAVALLFLGSYVTVYYRRWFTEAKTDENLTALQLHLAIGITVAVFIAVRIVWRMMTQPPAELPGPLWQHRAARLAHFALYALMIMMPITGYLGTGVATEYLGIPKFADTAAFQWIVADGLGLSFKEFEVPMDFLHKNTGAYVLWVLILVHAGAALYHHVILRDATLKRMTP